MSCARVYSIAVRRGSQEESVDPCAPLRNLPTRFPLDSMEIPQICCHLVGVVAAKLSVWLKGMLGILVRRISCFLKM